MNQVISNTGFESPCSTKGESFRFSPLWSNGPRLHGGNPIGFVPASRGGAYIKSIVDLKPVPLFLGTTLFYPTLFS
ncbi:MAG: hypothetical protein V3W08_11145, partial [Candidatus Binatia bacterium]